METSTKKQLVGARFPRTIKVVPRSARPVKIPRVFEAGESISYPACGRYVEVSSTLPSIQAADEQGGQKKRTMCVDFEDKADAANKTQCR